MKKAIFFLLPALLLLGAGCATTTQLIGSLFNEAYTECRRQPKGCDGKVSVTTDGPTEVGSNMVRINGVVAPSDEDGASAMIFFQYGTNSDGDKLEYVTEPVAVGVTSPRLVSIPMKGLTERTRYYYRIASQNKKGKVYGSVYYVDTVDQACLGPGTVAAFSGPVVTAYGFAASGTPLGIPLIIAGVGITSFGMFEEEISGNGSNPTCKIVAGVVGTLVAVPVYGSAKSHYRQKATPQQSSSSGGGGGGGGNNAPPPTVSGSGTGTGPAGPPRVY